MEENRDGGVDNGVTRRSIRAEEIVTQNLAQKSESSEESSSSNKEITIEFGGLFGALFLITLLPFHVIAVNVLCDERRCSYELPVLQPYKNLSTYLNVSVFLGVSIYAALLAFLSILPYGGRKVPGFFDKSGKLNYFTNGFFSTVIVLVILLDFEFNGVPIIDIIYDKYMQLTVSAVVLGVLISVFLYLHSFLAPKSALNPYGDTNNVVYDFFMGRELNPRIFGVLDAKVFLLRTLNISVVVLTTVLLCKSLGLNSIEFRESVDWKSLHIHPTQLTISALLYVYFLDGVLHEHTLIASFEMQHEGVGYMSCVWLLEAPFTYAIIPKYVMDYGVELDSWLLVASVVQFAVGYVLYRGGNNQKYAFRNNPQGNLVSHLETIPASEDKKLLVSGYWGFVRHPNYLGDILMHLSLLYFIIPAPPTLLRLATIPILVHRSIRDNGRCKKKYGDAWDSYCRRVKYVLVPKIY